MISSRSFRLSTAIFNLYLVFSVHIVQVICSERPDSLRVEHSSKDDPIDDRVNNVSTVQQIQKQGSSFSERQLEISEFSPSRQLEEGFGSRLRDAKVESNSQPSRGLRRVDSINSRPAVQRHVAGIRRPQQTRYRQRRPSLAFSDSNRNEQYSAYSQYSRAEPYRRRGSNHPFRVSGLNSRAEIVQGYDRAPFHDVRGGQPNYFEHLRPNNQPYRASGLNSLNGLSSEREDGGLLSDADQLSGALSQSLSSQSSGSSGGLFGALLGLLRPPKKSAMETDVVESSEPSYEFVFNNLDVDKLPSNKDTDTFIPVSGDYDDYNTDYTDQQTNEPEIQYTFKDVLESIRDKETRIETLKKFLSAASSKDRQGDITTLPITILFILGSFYALSAVAVTGYKYFLYSTNDSNGAAIGVLPIVILFTVPAVVAVAYVVIRSVLDGRVNLGRLARGDLVNGFRQDFGPMDFALDALVHSGALLGAGWIASILI